MHFTLRMMQATVFFVLNDYPKSSKIQLPSLLVDVTTLTTKNRWPSSLTWNVVYYRNTFQTYLKYGLFGLVYTLQGTNISPQNGILKMIFLFPRWDMLIP